MCLVDICKSCRDCNPVDTKDCPGCLIKSRRLGCNCRESSEDYEDDYRYDGLPRNPEKLRINKKGNEG